jgi:hypothetical protein
MSAIGKLGVVEMALKACKSCKHQVDTSAKTCPNCGVANPGVTAGQQVMGAVFLLIIIAVTFSMCSSKDDKAPEAEETKVDPAVCRADLQCWAEKKVVSASVYCKEPIERLAQYSSRWTDGTFDMKFSHYRWLNEKQGTVTYIGDKIEFQNGFGAFQKHIYECDLNPANDQVLAVRAHPGQL